MTTTPEAHKIGEPLSQDEAIASLSRYGYGWVDSDVAGASAQRGLSDAVVAATDPVSRAQLLAEALSTEGYAASTEHVGAGAQLCQHHCPVSHVAEEFPELCETEREAFAEILGTHVQRLATIVNGDCACTTHVPVTSEITDKQGAST